MAPKIRPDPNRPSNVTRLAAACTLLAVVALVLPVVRDVWQYTNPRSAKLTFDLSPQACAEVLMEAQSTREPCEITTNFAVHPLSKELVLFVDGAMIEIPTWKRDLKCVDGREPDWRDVGIGAERPAAACRPPGQQ